MMSILFEDISINLRSEKCPTTEKTERLKRLITNIKLKNFLKAERRLSFLTNNEILMIIIGIVLGKSSILPQKL